MSKQKNGKDPTQLTYKQQRFVEEIIVDWHIKHAAERAGYSPKTAHNSGWQLMQQDKIRNAIHEALQRQQERTRITADRALEEMARIAFADLRQAFDENGNLKAAGDMPDDVARAIASVKVFTNPAKEGEEATYTKQVRFWDKTKALEQIGKHFKMFAERREHTGEDGGPIQHEHNVSFEERLRDAKSRAQQERGGSGESDS